jgi:cytochrome c biogenesis protein CcmG/thiol:disulfide interchange protein DsbE
LRNRRGIHRRAASAALGVGVVAIVLIAVLATRGAAPQQGASTPLGGKVAPAIVGRDLRTGRAVDLASFRGKFVVVNFFAGWCVPCQEESGALSAFEFAHRKTGDATVIGVVYNDSAGDARSFLERSGATWPAVDDPGSLIAVAYGVSSPPRTFVIDPSGRVIGYTPGVVTEAVLNGFLLADGGRAS